ARVESQSAIVGRPNLSWQNRSSQVGRKGQNHFCAVTDEIRATKRLAVDIQALRPLGFWRRSTWCRFHTHWPDVAKARRGKSRLSLSTSSGEKALLSDLEGHTAGTDHEAPGRIGTVTTASW